jgi:hypothetical protein
MFHSWGDYRIRLYSRIGFRGEGTNIAKDDKSIKLNQILVHRMTSSKTIQKPESTARYLVLSRSMQDQQAWTRNTWHLDWSEFGYRERMTCLPCQAKDSSVQHVDHKQDRTESNQSKLGNKSVTWIKYKKIKFKATHGNLMNLLDLAKSNRADN